MGNHEAMRNGLRQVLLALDHVEVVAEVSNGPEVVEDGLRSAPRSLNA
jgi:DNA-binding NarL/FixJ family response regulator